MAENYYTIDFTAVFCKFEVLVNDTPIISLETEGQMSPNVPLNFGIYKSGKQKIEIILNSLDGEEKVDNRSKFEYSVKLYDVSNNTFTYIKDCLSNQIETEKDDHHTATFDAEIFYTLKSFENSESIAQLLLDDKNKVSEKLDAAFFKIQKSLENRDYETFSDIMKDREKNMATSMYLNSADSKARLNSLIEDREDGFSVMPLPEDKLIKIYGGGKLATYKKFSGEPAFYLFNENTGEEIMLDVLFHIPSGKEEFEVI